MKLAATLAALVLAALVLPFLLPRSGAPADQSQLPWRIKVLGDGRSEVFGLTLPTSTLAEARRVHGGEFDIGLIREASGALALEAYQPSARLGYVTGKLILSLDASVERLAQMAGRAADSEATRSGAWRLRLSAADARDAEQLAIAGISFIPSVDLDRDTVVDRFGEPARRIRQDRGTVHFLYPELGLDLLVDDDGRELLQYVAPAAFAKLFEPLTAGSAGQASAQ